MIDSKMSNQMILKEIGRRLEKLRINEGLDQKALAELSGVGLSTIGKIESGKTSTGLLNIIAILRVLGKLESLEYFIQPPPPVSSSLLNSRNAERKRVHKLPTDNKATINKFSWPETHNK
mgnify:CR=1 FL=1